jgi:branched-chain amino acid transport system substrate-binding protein
MKSSRLLSFGLALMLLFTPVFGASALFAAEDVTVGAIYPLTGPSAATAVDLRQGAELAIEIINGDYDLNLPLAKGRGLPNFGGKKIKYIFADHQGSPEKSLSEAERLITKEKVVALQGTYESSCAATASQVAERYGVPFLSDSCSSPTLHRRNLKWFFRTSPHDAQFAENFFKFLEELKKKKGINPKKVGIVWENTLYGTDAGKADRNLAGEYGYKIVADIPYTARSAELTSEIQKIKMSKPDVIFHAAYVSDAMLYVRGYKEMDVNFDMIFGHGGGFLDSAFRTQLGTDANYICSWEVWASDLAKSKPMVATVNDMFKKKYGRDMNGHSARAFTGVFVLADAINRAGSTEPKAIQQALRNTNIPGEKTIMPWTNIAFDKNGQNTGGSGIIVQIQDQAFKTIWPFEFASTDVVWPMPKWSERK